MTTMIDILSQIANIEDASLELTEETKDQLASKVDDYHEVLTKLAGMRGTLEHEIERLDAKVDTINKNIESVKAHLLYSMQRFGWEKLKGKFTQVSIRESKSVQVNSTNFAAFPAFTRTTMTESWDKAKIKKELDAGADLGGLAEIKVTKSLRFR